MAHVLSLRVFLSADTNRTYSSSSSSKSLKFDKRTNTSISAPRKGKLNPSHKTQKVNLDISPHRAVSAVRLMRIEMGGAFADLLNEKGKGSGENEMGYVGRTLGFRTRDLEDRDLRLVTDIVGGTIRWKRYLDHLISSLCHDANAFTRMEPLLLQILRIGFYEIVKLDMPPYAVVDENVRLAKVALRHGAGNMVNAILRKLVLHKENNSLPLPKLEGDDRTQARALATLHSHPVWMVRRWTKHLGQEETIRLMMWNNSDPSFSLRANSGKGVSRSDLVTKLNILKVPHELSSHLNDFVRMKTGLQLVIQAGLLKEGLCSVQDESAGLVVSVVDPQPGESIIDCCAAPGGKTLYMASLLSGQGMVYAIDINESRLRILEETAKLHQVDGVVTNIHSDIRSFADNDITQKNDKVLLDAPCSGLGVLSKRADLRWNRKLEDMEQLKNLQDELLDAASLLVVSVVDPQPGESIIDCCAAPGGKTLYMASLLSGQGMVYAIDINESRLRILEETAKLHQVDGVVTNIHSDIRSFADNDITQKNDKVLLDAPCSGLGVLSKRADLRWNRKLEDMEQLKNLQDELLDAASLLVKPGGVLVYSTCSIDPEENEDRVAAFLLRHPSVNLKII